MEPAPSDTFARPMTDLRISVTDRCNFRCAFCMPTDRSYRFVPKSRILRFEEITRLARLFLGFGVRKIRLTGGEPLLRAEIEHLVAALADLAGLRDLALTTNAHLLAGKAAALREAGLDRVTVSLHSLDQEIFARINGLGIELQPVLDGIDAALRAGLRPVKLNMVVIKGVNDHQVVELASFARDQGCVARFIEYMDVGTVNAWDPERVVSAREIIARIDRVFPVEPLSKDHPGEVAERYRYRDGAGEVGFITSVTQPFCGSCSRLRLSAEGKLFTCLFSAVGHDLRKPLRDGASDEELRDTIRSIWHGRSDRYSELRTAGLRSGRFVPADKVEMFRIGG
ncbi:MAG: GTP 3',8-cyclase MoaA [bacterium]|nr:GTP 3',8-cyclase MoaA [bacterium]